MRFLLENEVILTVGYRVSPSWGHTPEVMLPHRITVQSCPLLLARLFPFFSWLRPPFQLPASQIIKRRSSDTGHSMSTLCLPHDTSRQPSCPVCGRAPCCSAPSEGPSAADLDPWKKDGLGRPPRTEGVGGQHIPQLLSCSPLKSESLCPRCNETSIR